MKGLCANEIHEHLRGSWSRVLERLGVPPEALRQRVAQPCPACGGTDRYTFDDKHGRGDFFCRKCGPGTGFDLVMRVNNWDFTRARAEVIRVAGLDSSSRSTAPVARTAAPAAAVAEPTKAAPTSRVRRALAQSCAVEDCADVQDYLDSRGLWPLPKGHHLRAHVALPYYADSGAQTGMYSAMLAPVVDIESKLVTLHVTWLADGRKAQVEKPRKQISGTSGRTGLAIRLAPSTDGVLGIAEGIETALAAMRLHDVPTWSALDAGLLGKFEPPRSVEKLFVFADNDDAGNRAAVRLISRLQERVDVVLRLPPKGFKDWNDVLLANGASP
jgi:putative DNA primase/helicase